MTDQNISLEEIHSESFEDEFYRLLDEDLVEFHKENSEFYTQSSCPACGSENLKFSFVCKGFNHQTCCACGVLFINPCPGETQIIDFLQTSRAFRLWREGMPAALMESRKRMYVDRLKFVLDVIDRFKPTASSLLEIGAGKGEFARLLVAEDRLSRIVLVEPQLENLHLPKVSVLSQGITRVRLDNPVDVIVSFEVFEHLVNPDDFLEMAKRSLKPGGILLMTTPNCDGFDVTTLRELSYTVWFDHIRLYNPKAMKMMFKRHGFQVEEITTPGKFDFEIVHREFVNGNLSVEGRPELNFLLTDGYKHGPDFQVFLQRQKLSGHMRCVARRL